MLLKSSLLLTATLFASTPTPAFASSSASSSSSLCTVDAGSRRLSFFRGFLGSLPEAPCGIEEVLESGRAGGGAEAEAFRERQSNERRKKKEGSVSLSSSFSSSSFDERAALDEERERATQDFVDSMWQGLE